MGTQRFFIQLVVVSIYWSLAAAAGAAPGQSLIVDGSVTTNSCPEGTARDGGRACQYGGRHTFDSITLVNGAVIYVTPFDNNPANAASLGNLELISLGDITIDRTSRITAKGAGWAAIACRNGPGPTAFAGGRGGCAVRDSGGGGAHFGRGGKGTKDCFTVSPTDSCQFPDEWEEACINTGTGECNSGTTSCWNYDEAPTTAGQRFWHHILDVQTGAAGGDKGCRDSDPNPWNDQNGQGNQGGDGGGRIVLFADDGTVDIDGRVIADGDRGCARGNDSAGGGGGGTILIIGDEILVHEHAVISVKAGRGGDSQPKALRCTNNGDCGDHQTCRTFVEPRSGNSYQRCDPANCRPCGPPNNSSCPSGYTCRNFGGDFDGSDGSARVCVPNSFNPSALVSCSGSPCPNPATHDCMDLGPTGTRCVPKNTPVCDLLDFGDDEDECDGDQNTGTCDDCAGGGGGGIINLQSRVADIDPRAIFNVSGGKGGICPICEGEAGGGAGELQIDGAYVGEVCDGYDNDFDGSTDEGLGSFTCGMGSCAASLQRCGGGEPTECDPDMSSADDDCYADYDEARPRVVVILDTSATMLLDLAGLPTFGDGSVEQPSRSGADDSRLYLAREALAQVVSAYPEIDFALARYHQDQGIDRSCQTAAWFECQGLIATYDDPSNNTGAVACSNLAVSGGTLAQVLVDPNGDHCINYAGSCGAPRRGADILSGFGSQTHDLVRWIDGQETDTSYITDITTGDICRHSQGGDCEVRATGQTPLAGSLQAVADYIKPVRATDPSIECRDYTVILVTDGLESCNGDPVTAAEDLFTDTVNGRGIRVYVIGVALPDDMDTLNEIAAAGGTTDATPVNAPEDFVPALTEIIAESIRTERCNNIDDDCDGLTDEDFPALGESCHDDAIGLCRDWGQIVCDETDPDRLSTRCDLTLEPDPGPDAPTDEVCNNIDDNCDGLVDNDIDPRDCGNEFCSGEERCVAGNWAGCTAPPALPEVCNDEDDDCDGMTDEDEDGDPLRRTCATACGLGEEICEDGEYGDCDAPEPDSEVCNNLDDDCDGIIDDGNPGGGDTCLPNPDGTYELVENPDDVASDDIICDLGTVTCMAGELVCVGATGGTQEVCNCLDDDCDGEIDEDPNLCGEGAQCIDCRCVSPCFPGEFPCPVNRYCDESYADEARNIIGLCVPGKCDGVECPENAICQPLTGECEDVCANTVCAEGESCVRGLCIENNCYGRGCPVGERCRNDTCEADPCFGIDCEANQFCRDGGCIDACLEACSEQEFCEDGQCVTHPCGEPCYLGYFCVDGACVENTCDECGEGRVCQGDSCVDDPCEGIKCPGETECHEGQCMIGGEPQPLKPSDGQEEQEGSIRRVLVTGGGGCDCTIAGPPAGGRLGSSGALVFIFGMILLVWRRSKRLVNRSRSLTVWSIVFVLAMILMGGCRVEPFPLTSTGEDEDSGMGGNGKNNGKSDSGQTQQGEGGPSEFCTTKSEEICNEEDDDCDGFTDEDFDLDTDLGNCGACNRKCLLPQAFAKCESGECAIEQCEAGYQDLNGNVADGCEYPCTRTGNEICDGRDNDCDGLTDEGLDLLSDIANCGACGRVCQFPNASASCESGVCVMGDCVTTYYDANDDPSDGCELNCVPSEEICNGADDDCDGDIDEDLTPPEELCVNTSHTPCEDVEPVCDTRDAGTTWYCDYPDEVEFNDQVSNGISSEETLCDGEDNDCDGQTDEPFADLGTACGDEGFGICRATGTIQCISDDETGCVITNPAQDPQDERCNGKDDDCDGQTDEQEEVVDDMVHIDHHGLDFYIYRYEASRPDATEDSSGISEARACSNADVMPWSFVSYDAASEACEDAGHRLCTSNEWLAACESASGFVYPYGNTYNKTACNGADRGAQSSQALRVIPTGSLSSCSHPSDPDDALVFDMSGNVKEWTNDSAGTASDTTPIFVVRGGSFETPKFGLDCQTVLSQALSTTLLPGLGFRCCRDDAP